MMDGPQENPTPSSPPLYRRLWVYGLWVGLGIMLMSLLFGYFMGRPHPGPAMAESERRPIQGSEEIPNPSARVPAAIPEDPATLLKSQLEQVLSGIKAANQKKDLSELLSYYSPSFPRLPQRAQTISKTWKIYEYPKMEFKIDEIKRSADDTALAKVTWEVEARNISNQSSKNFSKTYLVTFGRESGQWRIKALEAVE